MDPINAASGMLHALRVEQLTETAARRWAGRLVVMNADQAEDYWTVGHLLAARPEKWQRSKVALIGEIPVGYVIASRATDSVHVHHLVVTPHMRGHGIGRALLTQVLAEADGPVTAKAVPANMISIALFRSLGFHLGARTSTGYLTLARPGPAGVRVAGHQPNYAPWCGFFAKLFAADVFILDATVQFPRRGYINRVRIARDRNHARWLTIPIRHGRHSIGEVEFADDGWARHHLKTLRITYGRAPFAEQILAELEPEYTDPGTHLADFNTRLIRHIARYLCWTGRFVLASDYEIPAGLRADERITRLVRAIGGTTYISGAGGQNYQSPETFAHAGLDLQVRAYQPIPYDRRRAAWLPGLSILDALVHLGPQARSILSHSQ